MQVVTPLWKNPAVPRFYHSGLGSTPSATPPEIADAPLDALRSQLYPVYPDAPQQVYDQQGNPLPIGMPQRMMFTRWKSGSAAIQFTQNAQGYVSARDYGEQHSGVLVAAAGVPPVQMSPASFGTSNGATALTVQTVNPNIHRRPLTKGYLPPDEYLTATDLANFVAQDKASREIAAQNAAIRASAAHNEVAAVKQSIFARIGSKPRPWYSKG